MKKALKIIGAAFAALFIIIVIAVVVVWNKFDAAAILNIINSNKAKLKEQHINLNIKNLSINKQFPYLTVRAQQITITSGQFNATCEDIYDKINIVKFLISLAGGKYYAGKIKISKANVVLLSSNQKTNINEIHFPTIPVDLEIKQILLKYKGYKLTGGISSYFNPITNSNSIHFIGKINTIFLKLSAKLSKKYLTLNIFTPHIIFNSLNATQISANIKIGSSKQITIDASGLDIRYKKFIFIKPRLMATLNLQKPLEIETLQFRSNNGYAVKLKGSIDATKPLKSVVFGSITTPFISLNRITPFLPEDLKNYLLKGKVKLDNINFAGKPPISFIRNGKVIIENAEFRINTKDRPFFVNKATVNITPEKLKAEGYGNFEGVKAKKALFIVYRKNLSSDIHLLLDGSLNDYVRLFLENNILGKNDLKIIGKTSNLKGYAKATVDVYGYRFKPKPYFDFDINIVLNNVELINKNIPNGYIKAKGNLRIKRTTSKGRVVKLFLNFKNFTAQTKTSYLDTNNFVLTIQPALHLKGNITTRLSSVDLKKLFKEFNKTPPKVLLNAITVKKAFIDGTPANLSFRLNTKLKFTDDILDSYAEGIIKNNILSLKNITIKGFGKSTASAKIDLSKEKILSLKAQFNNFKIETISKLMGKNYSGIVNGNITIQPGKNKPYLKTGNLLLENIKIYNYILPHGSVSIKNNLINFKVDVKHNKETVTADGKYNYNNNSLAVKGFCDSFTVDLTKKHKNTSLKTIKLPKMDIDAVFSTIALKIKKRNGSVVIGPAKLVLLNNKNKATMYFVAVKSRININYDKYSKKIVAKVKDSAIWSALTDCTKPTLQLKIEAILHNPYTDIIDPLKLNGLIDFEARNGCIKNTPAAINLFSLLNPFKLSLSGYKISKGIDYDTLKAHLFLKNGSIEAKENKPLYLKGKTLDLFAYGTYDLNKSFINGYVTFITFSTINSIVSEIPIIGYILTGKQKSFTGLCFKVKGNINNPSIKPVPFKNLAKGVFGVVKRTLELPLELFGVGK
ncbi:AsmA-like C-terminal domain-containing protein [Hippea jasoniae]|uniref:AsmA-like C-terminal domain-containing protein n=1 Tax=Hippea jasoniae TaxID=944479 RepID=UPI0005562EE0|nr:AsmA-like C-terminal domain-containing protein [Hippea jasoniae]